MTLKQRAALQTLAILAVIVGSSLGITLVLQQFTPAEIVNGLAILSIMFLIYSMYGVILSRLEYKETLNKLVDKQ